MSDQLAIAKKKLVAVRRAERRLIHRLDDIDWEYAELLPEIEKLELTFTKKAQIPQFTVEHEN